MNALLSNLAKKSSKQEREQQVLFGLIEYYIKTGKPVGSNTLKETGFEELSSATIRNYFADLEEKGYLEQQHASGGRIPTPSAFRLYAKTVIDSTKIGQVEEDAVKELNMLEGRQIAQFLQSAAELLSRLTDGAIFISAPRFDHDYITTIKMVPIDHQRSLAVIVTDFGVVQSEIFYHDKKLSTHDSKKIEEYFHWRLTGHDKPQAMDQEMEERAKALYNEVFIRYVIRYSTFVDEDIYRTGFSKLLSHPEFRDPNALAHSLAVFENAHTVRLLLRECAKMNAAKFWIADDLSSYTTLNPECGVIAIPYYINQQAVGAIGLLGPIRMPYRSFFALMRSFSEKVSEVLTQSVYKFKIGVRQPSQDSLYLKQNGNLFLENHPHN